MKTAVTSVLMLIRLCGLILIILGILFWINRARDLVGAHMLIGLVLVLLLWTLAYLAARMGVGVGPVAVAAFWGVLVVVLGIAQTRLLPGDAHWLIQALHLLVGLIAIGLAEMLGGAIRRSGTA